MQGWVAEVLQLYVIVNIYFDSEIKYISMWVLNLNELT